MRSGTFTLIVSIILVIAIIVFFFRGVLNFNTTSKSLKILAYVWIAQNVFMIISAMQRNQMYIAQYGMTHKRIGVYIFLLLAIIGLIVALYKVIKTMNLWFIIRKSVWAFYAVLIVLSAVNWDYIITAYNIKLANKNFIIDLDKDYLAGLSHANTYMLAIQETNEVPLEFYDFNNDYNMRNDKQNEKIRALFGYDERKQWQEKCINKDKNVAILKSLNAKGKLTKLDLYANWLNEIPVYKNLDQVKGINLVNNQVGNNLNNLKYYPNVQVLNLSGNEITHLDSLPLLAELTHLNLSNNQVFDFNSLSNVPNITNLDISNQQIEIKAEKFPKLANLKSIKLNNSSIREFAFLKDLNHLEELFLEANNHRMGNIPLLPALKKLSLQQSNIFDQSPNLLIQFSKNNTLEELNLEGCNLQSTYYLLFPNTKTALFPSLKTLNLKNNNLRTNVNFLASYSQLIALDLSNNSLDETAALSALTQLKTLQLNDNVNVKLSFLKALTQLEALEIQNIGIKSLKETKEMQNLKKLNVASNNIANLNDIAIPNSITDLDLSNNNISDINALATLKNLKTLSIAQNNITDFSVLYTMTHLEELNLGEIPLEIVELLKKKLPKTRINYYSNKLNLDISYSNIRKASFDESF